MLCFLNASASRLYGVTSLMLLLSCSPAVAVPEADGEEFTIGSKLPPIPQLTAVDGATWDSEKLAAAKVLIIAFTCNHCPYAVDYEDRLNALHDKYSAADGEVMLLVINSNAGSDESLARMAARAKEKRFEFPYVKDADQSVARSLGAVYTPEFFVFDQDRRLVYQGAMDDATRSEDVNINYIHEAVAAVLAGEAVKTPTTGARGCTIRFKRKRARRGQPQN